MTSFDGEREYLKYYLKSRKYTTIFIHLKYFFQTGIGEPYSVLDSSGEVAKSMTVSSRSPAELA